MHESVPGPSLPSPSVGPQVAVRNGADIQRWLAAKRFTVADLHMPDVLRVSLIRAHGKRPATEAYIQRFTGRPAFRKVYADQMAHFAAAQEARSTPGTL